MRRRAYGRAHVMGCWCWAFAVGVVVVRAVVVSMVCGDVLWVRDGDDGRDAMAMMGDDVDGAMVRCAMSGVRARCGRRCTTDAAGDDDDLSGTCAAA